MIMMMMVMITMMVVAVIVMMMTTVRIAMMTMANHCSNFFRNGLIAKM